MVNEEIAAYRRDGDQDKRNKGHFLISQCVCNYPLDLRAAVASSMCSTGVLSERHFELMMHCLCPKKNLISFCHLAHIGSPMDLTLDHIMCAAPDIGLILNALLLKRPPTQRELSAYLRRYCTY